MGIFAVPAVHSFLGYFFAKGAAELMMLQTAPIFFVEKFGLSPIEAGAYIAAAKTINVPASFFTGEHRRRWQTTDGSMLSHGGGCVSGIVESTLKLRGVPNRRIRQFGCAMASVGCRCAEPSRVLSRPGTARLT